MGIARQGIAGLDDLHRHPRLRRKRIEVIEIGNPGKSRDGDANGFGRRILGGVESATVERHGVLLRQPTRAREIRYDAETPELRVFGDYFYTAVEEGDIAAELVNDETAG